MPLYDVYIRGSIRPVEVDAQGNTIRHLRDAVAALFLSDAYLLDATPLQAQAILIYGIESHGSEVSRLPPVLDDVSLLSTTVQYTAYEVFTTVPRNLYRTVKTNQAHPVVDAVPGNQFTKVASLFCTALTPTESIDPPFYYNAQHKGRRVSVRGASLTWKDASEPATVGLTSEVDANESTKAPARIALDDAVFLGTYREGTEFGVLHTSSIYKHDGAQHLTQLKSKHCTVSGIKKTRTYFWRYVIPMGTDLSGLGVSLVYDKAENGHFSLIPNQVNATYRAWSNVSFHQPNLLRPDPNQPEPPIAMPESITWPYDSVNCVAYPLVAKKFQLHDMIMKAAGFVLPDEPYEDKDCQKLAQAAEVVFDHGDELLNSYEIYEALDVLSSFAFDVKKAPFDELRILLNAMTEIQDSADDIGDDEESALSLGAKAIDDYCEKCAKGSPQSVISGLEDEDDTPRIAIFGSKDKMEE